MILIKTDPVNDMYSTAAKIFSSQYAQFSGIVFLSMAAMIFAPIAFRSLHFKLVEDDPG